MKTTAAIPWDRGGPRNVELGRTGPGVERYGLDVRDILIEVGRRGMAGCPEDMIVDSAVDVVAARAGSRA